LAAPNKQLKFVVSKNKNLLPDFYLLKIILSCLTSKVNIGRQRALPNDNEE
jgi:hypothetical protein